MRSVERKRSMKYSEIYSEEFLNKFDENKEKIGNLELDIPNNWAIDLNAILDILNIDLKEVYTVDFSGKLDQEDDRDVIKVCASDTEGRKRFTISHEIGHYILKHEGILYRKTSKEEYDTYIKQIREFSANQIAAELLMPEKIVYMSIKQTMREKNWDESKALSTEDIDYLIQETAKKMNTSVQAMEYRVKNLEVFVKID